MVHNFEVEDTLEKRKTKKKGGGGGKAEKDAFPSLATLPLSFQFPADAAGSLCSCTALDFTPEGFCLLPLFPTAHLLFGLDA